MDKLPGTEANHRGDTVMDVCRLLDTPLHGLFGTEANNILPVCPAQYTYNNPFANCVNPI